MELWTAFILGLAGSLHCAAMCGPLTLLVPVTGPRMSQKISSRLLYNAGRLFTYAILGALFGAFGRAFAIVGLQRWISVIAGVVVLLGLGFSTFHVPMSAGLNRIVTAVKSRFSVLLRKRTLPSIASLGALNGLLPCGLVYIAATASAATANSIAGALYMVVFGLGTVPMLLMIGLGGGSVRLSPLKVKRLMPIVAAVAGVLLIVRGLGLGIPYVSPAPSGHCPACVAVR
jgi:sulfite exporter TauE/SafE